MIIPDLNLLVYAYNEDAPLHPAAKAWWEQCLSATEPVGLAWVVLLGFVRLMSSRRVLLEPMSASEAVDHCRAWLAQPSTRIVMPGPTHIDVLSELGGDHQSAPTLLRMHTWQHSLSNTRPSCIPTTVISHVSPVSGGTTRSAEWGHGYQQPGAHAA